MLCLYPRFLRANTRKICLQCALRTWLAMIVSLGAGMLLFMMIPALMPLNAVIMNVGFVSGRRSCFQRRSWSGQQSDSK